MSPFFGCIVLGYLIGSLPTTYILVKLTKQIDIFNAGSKNVGAMNTFEVTQSKILGTLVLFLDILKGVCAVAIAGFIFGWNEQVLPGVSGISSIIGHDFPVWLKFRGGKGLAVTAGVMLVCGWLFVVAWCLLWGVSYKTTGDLHKANIISSVICPLLLFAIPGAILIATLPHFINAKTFYLLSVATCLLILIRHDEQIKVMWNKITNHS